MAKRKSDQTAVPTVAPKAQTGFAPPPPPSYLRPAASSLPSSKGASSEGLENAERPLPLIGRVGLGAFVLALFLAPIIGGAPAGSQYGSDTALGAIRLLVLVAAVLLHLTLPIRYVTEGLAARIARSAVWTAFALTLASLLVHSRFLSSPTLLFAQVPATLDWLCYTLAFALCARLASDRRTALTLLGAVGAGLLWCAVAGALEYAPFKQAGQIAHRTQGTFFSPNFAAGFYGLCLPVAVAAFVGARERLAVFGLGATSALAFGLLVATGSRAGVLLTLAGLAVALVLALACRALPSGRETLARVGALLALFAVLGFAFRGPLLGRVSGDSAQGGGGAQASAAATGQDQSSDFRKWTWRGSVKMAQANPVFGTGPGTFPVRYPPYALVAKTDLAHSSYLQVADEQGAPALVSVAIAIAAAWLAAVAGLWRGKKATTTDEEPEAQGEPIIRPRLLACGLAGGLLVGAARSFFDSEWSVFGNGLPFWAIAGLASGSGAVALTLSDAVAQHASNARFAAAQHRVSLLRSLARPALVAAAIAGLAAFLAASAQDTVVAAAKTGQPPRPESVSTGAWPAQPELFFYSGKPEKAVQIEPSGRQFFRLARLRERDGDGAGAIAAFKQAVEADPNNTQAWKAFAEAQEKNNDNAGALASWRRLVNVHEGPAGLVRAIPELADTFPAYAYYALAQGADQTGDKRAASDLYAKAAQVVEDYAQTPPLYQTVEFSVAASPDVVLQRRGALRALYDNIIAGLKKDPPFGMTANALDARKAETLRRLDAFAPPPGSAASN